MGLEQLQSRREVETLLRALDPSTERFTFQTFDDDKERGSQSLVRTLHGTLAEHWNELVRLNNVGAAICVAPNETNLKGRSSKDVVRVRAVFVESWCRH
jgi:hypothetical protein